MNTMHDEIMWHKTLEEGKSRIQQALEEGSLMVVYPTPKEEK